MKKHTVKAMAIGLSAATLVSSADLTAFAEETTVPEGGEASEEVVVANEAEAAAVETAKEVVEEGIVDSVAEEAEDIDAAAASEAIADEFADEVAAVDEALAAVTDENAGVQASIESAAGSLETVETAAEAIDTAVADADVATDAAVETSADLAAKAKDNQAAAEEAYDQVVAAVEAKNQTAAANVLADANAAQEQAKEDFDAAEEDYLDALDAYETAKDDYETAKTAYNEALESAKGDLGTAKAELEAAQAALDELQKAADKALDELVSTGAGAIVTAQQSAGKNWDTENDYFYAIMQYYYLPEVVGASLENGQTIDTDSIKVNKFVKKANGSDEDNYCTVSYDVVSKDEDGNEIRTTVTKDYNYKLSKSEKSKDNGLASSDKTQLLIFEKTVEYSYTDAEGNTSTVTQEEMDEMISNGSAVVRYYDATNNKYYTEAEANAAGLDTAKLESSYVVLGSDWSEGKIEGLDETKKTSYTLNGTTVEVTRSEELADGESTSLYTFDENGNYICIVTQPTVKKQYTYKNGTLAATTEFDTEEEAKAAANEELLKIALKDNQEIIDSAITTGISSWTASGTYVLRSTVTNKVSENNNDSWLFTKKPDGSTAIADVKGNAKDDANNKYSNKEKYYNYKFDGYNDDWKATEVSQFKHVTVEFNVTGSYNVSYNKVTSEKVSYTTWQKIADDFKSLFGKEPTKAQIEAAIKADVEAKGGIYIGMDWNDGNMSTGTVHYVAGHSIDSSKHYNTKEDAENAAISDAIGKGYSAVDNVNLTTNDWYKADGDYVVKTTDTSEDSYTSTSTNSSSDASISNKYSNANWKKEGYTGTLMGDWDDAFKSFISEAKSKYTAYTDLLAKVAKAQETLKTAQGNATTAEKNLQAIQDKVDKLNKTALVNGVDTNLAKWEAALVVAQDNYTRAQAALDAAQTLVDNATALYDATVWPVPYTPSNAGTTTSTASAIVLENVNAPIAAHSTIIADEAVPLAGAARRAVTVINGTQTPLAGDADEAADTTSPVVVDEADDTQNEVISIEDEETPLGINAAGILQRSWWWLILVILAVAGTLTAYYENKKMKAAEKETDDLDK